MPPTLQRPETGQQGKQESCSKEIIGQGLTANGDDAVNMGISYTGSYTLINC